MKKMDDTSDEPGAVFAEMEIVAHQSANRAVIHMRDFRRPGEDCCLVCGEPRRRLDCCDYLLHLGHLAGREEHWHIREQMRLGLDESLAELRVASLALKRLAQRLTVEGDAEAILVQPLREGLNWTPGRVGWIAHRPQSPGRALAGRASGPM